MNRQTQGMCPYCDSEIFGVYGGWAMSPEGMAEMKRKHDFGHQDNRTISTTEIRQDLSTLIKIAKQEVIEEILGLEGFKEEVIDENTTKQAIDIEKMNEGNVSAREILEDIGKSFNQRNSLRNQIKQQIIDYKNK